MISSHTDILTRLLHSLECLFSRSFVNGIPRHDRIAQVMTKLKAEDIEQAFQSWMKTLVQTTGIDIIAVDSKTARHSFDTRERTNPLHSVSAWRCSNQLVLGQAAVDDKSNEITAIPKLLALLDMRTALSRSMLWTVSAR